MSLRVLKTALRKPEPVILANFILMSVQMSEICIKKGKTWSIKSGLESSSVQI